MSNILFNRRHVPEGLFFKLLVVAMIVMALILSVLIMFKGGLHNGVTALFLFTPIWIFGGGFIAYWVDNYRWNRRQVSPDSSTEYKPQETPEAV